jgi:aspartate carbamoyltransferase catalytic subunit
MATLDTARSPEDTKPTQAAGGVWERKDLLGLEELTAEEILILLNTAASFKDVSLRSIKKVPALRGKTVANCFFEPSTRTRTSFDLAAKRLSADILTLSGGSTSLEKGETLLDTVKTLEAMHVDVLVIRHNASGAAQLAANHTGAAVINAGDGSHEHPTQALLDLFTMREHFDDIAGKRVAIIGDIAHSRVARSNIWGLTKLGASVVVCGPPPLLPLGIEELGVEATSDVHEAIRHADVLMILRIQHERQELQLIPSIREYTMRFGITRERLKGAKKDVMIMHPGPVNRGVELAPDVADGPYSVILHQVTNGLAVRMAALHAVTQGKERLHV